MLELTKVNEQFSATGQLSVADINDIKRQGFRTIINSRPDNEEQGQIASAELEAAARAAGLQFIHIPIVPNQMSPEQVAQFKQAIENNEGPYLGFCKTGRRATTIWQAAESL